MRGGKFTSLNIFSVQEHASSKSRHILNFRIVAVRGISYKRVCRKIYTYIGIFSSFRSKSTRKSAYSLFDSSVLVISGLDNKSKFQMFTLFPAAMLVSLGDASVNKDPAAGNILLRVDARWRSGNSSLFIVTFCTRVTLIFKHNEGLDGSKLPVMCLHAQKTKRG